MIDLTPPPLILPSHYEAKRPAIIRVEPNPERHFPELRRAGLTKAMLPGMVPIVAGRVALSLLFNAGYSSSADASSYSFPTSGIPFGDKLVIATAHWNSTQPLRTVTSRTIGGLAATSAIGGGLAFSGQAGSSIGLDIFYCRLADANPTIAWSLDAAGSVRAYTGVWYLTGSLLSTVPYDSDKTASAGTSISRQIDIAAGGVGVMALTIDNAVAPTISGLDTTDWNLTHAEGGTRMAGGRYASAAGQINRSISATYASGAGEAMAVASWR